MTLLENYIKAVLLEKGRFKKGEEFSAWLVGLDCETEEFNDIFNSFSKTKKSKGKDIIKSGAFIFNKDESIMDHIEERIGNENIHRVGNEFKDNLPVFICINKGDLANQKKEKINLASNLGWMVHDIWHQLVDWNEWYSDISKKSKSIHIKHTRDQYSISPRGNKKNSELKKLNQSDALIFLNYYNFTPGVGEIDTLPSLAAFCVMKRDISSVDKKIFKEKMENYDDFASFYKRLYVLSPLLWKSLFKLFKGKVVCLNLF